MQAVFYGASTGKWREAKNSWSFVKSLIADVTL
jgi:hypothetical protein